MKGTGTVRKRGDVWYYRYYSSDGKRIERKGGKTKAIALKALNEEINRELNGYSRPEETTLNDFFETWLEDYIKDTKSENTYHKYRNSFETKIKKSFIGCIKLCDLKVVHIEKYIKHLKKVNLSNTSIQFHYGVLKTALNKAIKLQMIIDTPCKYVDTPKREKFKPNILTLEEFNTIYTNLKDDYEDHIMRLALDISLETGLRRGEMCGLSWDSIDFENNIIEVNKAYIRIGNTYKISGLKTESSYRRLPISDFLISKLKTHKKIQHINKLKYGEFYIKNIFDKKEYDLVFTWESGKLITPSNFLQRLKRLCKYNNIYKNIRWHDLRHTNATLLLENGTDMKTLQDRLGHSLMQTTSDIYSHVTEEMNRKATNVFENLRKIK